MTVRTRADIAKRLGIFTSALGKLNNTSKKATDNIEIHQNRIASLKKEYVGMEKNLKKLQGTIFDTFEGKTAFKVEEGSFIPFIPDKTKITEAKASMGILAETISKADKIMLNLPRPDEGIILKITRNYKTITEGAGLFFTKAAEKSKELKDGIIGMAQSIIINLNKLKGAFLTFGVIGATALGWVIAKSPALRTELILLNLQFDKVARAIGKDLKPFFTALREEITKLTDAFLDLNPETRNTISLFIGLAGAIGFATLAVSGFLLVVSPIVLGIAALALGIVAIILIWQNLELVMENINKLYNSSNRIMQVFGVIFALLVKPIRDVKLGLEEFMDTMKKVKKAGSLKKIFDTVFLLTFKRGIDDVKESWDKLVAVVDKIREKQLLKKALQFTFELFMTSPIFSSIINFIDALTSNPVWVRLFGEENIPEPTGGGDGGNTTPIDESTPPDRVTHAGAYLSRTGIYGGERGEFVLNKRQVRSIGGATQARMIGRGGRGGGSGTTIISPTIIMNVNGAQGQDEQIIADIVNKKLTEQLNRLSTWQR